jgi:hypothetical protein
MPSSGEAAHRTPRIADQEPGPRYNARMRPALLVLAAAVACLALAARAVDPAPTTPAPRAPGAPPGTGVGPTASDPPRTDVRMVAGKITAVDRTARVLVLAADDGPLRVAFDRNTMVFLQKRLGSLGDLAPGVPARANVLGPLNLAAWIELTPLDGAPSPGAG